MATAATVAGLAAANPSFAQAPAQGQQVGVEELVVTARRREESLQEVPVAVTALSGQALEARSVRDVADLAAVAPGLQISTESRGTGYARINLRGQENASGASTFDPAVGIYFSEVYVGRTAGSLLTSLQDMRSVEVLRGVQGTLFGRNSNGGAILLTPNAPDASDVAGSFGVSYGSYDRTELSGMINVPLIADRLAFRASINSVQQGDVQRSLTTSQGYGDRDRLSGRAALRFDVTPDLYVDLMYDGTTMDEHGTMSVNKSALRPGQGWHQTLAGERAIADIETEGYTLRAVHEAEDLTVKGIFGYRKVKVTATRDVDGTLSGATDTQAFNATKQVSGEINASGTILRDAASWLQSVDWTGGVFGFHEYGYDNSWTPWFPGVTPANSRLKQVDVDNKSAAAYAQVELHFTDRLSYWAGARYTQDKRYVRTGQFRNNACVDVPGASIADCQIVGQKDYDYWSWSTGLRYQLADNIHSYLRAASGARAGGLDNNTARSFDPETVTDIELGLKADWLDRRLRTNLAIYRSEYEEIQRTSVVIDSVGSPIATTSNAAAGQVQGVELEGTAILGGGFGLSGSLAYTDASYDTYLRRNQNGTVTDLSDKDYPDTPKWTYSISGTFDREFEGFGAIAARIDYAWRDDHFLDITNDPILEQKAFGLLNARLAWTPEARFGDVELEVALWGRNLTDEEWNTSGVINGVQYLDIRSDNRRMVGVELRGKF
jgi:iron complex outermembrane receptor protein